MHRLIKHFHPRPGTFLPPHGVHAVPNALKPPVATFRGSPQLVQTRRIGGNRGGFEAAIDKWAGLRDVLYEQPLRSHSRCCLLYTSDAADDVIDV